MLDCRKLQGSISFCNWVILNVKLPVMMRHVKKLIHQWSIYLMHWHCKTKRFALGFCFILDRRNPPVQTNTFDQDLGFDLCINICLKVCLYKSSLFGQSWNWLRRKDTILRYKALGIHRERKLWMNCDGSVWRHVSMLLVRDARRWRGGGLVLPSIFLPLGLQSIPVNYSQKGRKHIALFLETDHSTIIYWARDGPLFLYYLYNITLFLIISTHPQ